MFYPQLYIMELISKRSIKAFCSVLPRLADIDFAALFAASPAGYPWLFGLRGFIIQGIFVSIHL
jgi:hypothetical protein